MTMIKEREQLQPLWQEEIVRRSRETSRHQLGKTKTKKPIYKRTYQDFIQKLSSGDPKRPLHISRASLLYSNPRHGLGYQNLERGTFAPQKVKPGQRLTSLALDATRKAFTVTPTLLTYHEREQRLLAERDALLNCEDTGTLSKVQTARLRHVEAELDRLEDQNPVEQEADRRLTQTGDKLNEILILLRSLPRKEAKENSGR